MIYFVGNQPLIESIFETCSIEDVKNWCKTHKVRGIDTETIGNCWDGYIYTLQIGNANTQFVIDCTAYDILLLKEELEDPEALNILQNGKYDDKFFMAKGIKLGNIYDTFLAECILTTGIEERELRLDHLVNKYCEGKYSLDKSVRGKINYVGLTDEVIQYAAFDVIALEEIMIKQKAELEKWDLMSVAELEFKCSRIFGEMEFTGMLLDKDKWITQAETREREAHKFEDQLNEFIISNSDTFYKFIDRQLDLFSTERKTCINWSSPKQVLDIFSTAGLKVDSVNEKVIEKYRVKFPIVDLYLKYKENQTAISKFGKDYLKWVNSKTNSIHTSYWQILATGRVSSGIKDEAPKNIGSLKLGELLEA